RPHALGKFGDLLRGTAAHPAMLFYLDNWLSARPDFTVPVGPNRGKRAGLNENYARELMELHTLGVDGGYTQKDVTEVARAFTGWTIEAPMRGVGFRFEPRLHDPGQKIVLGHVIKAGGGESDGAQVLDILAGHRSTASRRARRQCSQSRFPRRRARPLQKRRTHHRWRRSRSVHRSFRGDRNGAARLKPRAPVARAARLSRTKEREPSAQKECEPLG